MDEKHFHDLLLPIITTLALHPCYTPGAVYLNMYVNTLF